MYIIGFNIINTPAAFGARDMAGGSPSHNKIKP